MSVRTYLELRWLRQSAGLAVLCALFLNIPIDAQEDPYAEPIEQGCRRVTWNSISLEQHWWLPIRRLTS